jgi:hypothetical protein
MGCRQRQLRQLLSVWICVLVLFVCGWLCVSKQEMSQLYWEPHQDLHQSRKGQKNVEWWCKWWCAWTVRTTVYQCFLLSRMLVIVWPKVGRSGHKILLWGVHGYDFECATSNVERRSDLMTPCCILMWMPIKKKKWLWWSKTSNIGDIWGCRLKHLGLSNTEIDCGCRFNEHRRMWACRGWMCW